MRPPQTQGGGKSLPLQPPGPQAFLGWRQHHVKLCLRHHRPSFPGALHVTSVCAALSQGQTPPPKDTSQPGLSCALTASPGLGDICQACFQEGYTHRHEELGLQHIFLGGHHSTHNNDHEQEPAFSWPQTPHQ